MKNSPCLNCRYRSIGCHNVCDNFKNYRVVVERVKTQMIMENDFLGYLTDSIKRMRRG